MKVKYFAWVRERVGLAEETIEPPAEVRTVNDLIGWLSSRGEAYAHAFDHFPVARVLDALRMGRGLSVQSYQSNDRGAREKHCRPACTAHVEVRHQLLPRLDVNRCPGCGRWRKLTVFRALHQGTMLQCELER